MTLATCPACGKTHDALSGSIPVSTPTEAARIPAEERQDRVWSNGELCVVDDERFYFYGSIEIRIHRHSESFIWGAWVEVAEKTFFSYQELLDAEGRETHAPFEATLGTDIPFYPRLSVCRSLFTSSRKGCARSFSCKPEHIRWSMTSMRRLG